MDEFENDQPVVYQLQEELHLLLQKYHHEYNISIPEILGMIEIVKNDILSAVQYDEDEEDDPNNFLKN